MTYTATAHGVDLTITQGEQTWHNANHHADKNTRTRWYRHDIVTHNGKEIGRIQVRAKRFGRQDRIDITTICGGLCVFGSNVEWLVKQNGLA